VFALYKLFATPEQAAEMAARYRAGGLGYGTAKKELLPMVLDYFADARARKAELEANPDYVEDVLRAGGDKARAVACATLGRCRAAAGL
jgi:tryptophanyl-tRNA synthetase